MKTSWGDGLNGEPDEANILFLNSCSYWYIRCRDYHVPPLGLCRQGTLLQDPVSQRTGKRPERQGQNSDKNKPSSIHLLLRSTLAQSTSAPAKLAEPIGQKFHFNQIR